MQVRSSFDFGDELHRIALTRVLDRAPVGILGDGPARRRAYAASGFAIVTASDDAEAIRRSLLFRAFVAPRAFGVAA